MKPYHRSLVFFLILTGAFIGALRIYEYVNRPAEVMPGPTPNPLQREIDPIVLARGQESELLRAAMGTPEALLAAKKPVSHESSPEHFAPAIVQQSVASPQRSPISDPREAELTPMAASTGILYRSFDSLRDPAIADPQSEQNQRLLRKMIQVGREQGERPPVIVRSTPPRSGR